jgi:hypothetical protein
VRRSRLDHRPLADRRAKFSYAVGHTTQEVAVTSADGDWWTGRDDVRSRMGRRVELVA